MNILMVTGPFVSLREPYKGGTEAFVADLADNLVRQGHRVDVLAKDADEQKLFEVVKLRESVLSMKDIRRSEDVGQEYYQSFQYGLMDLSSYDVIHYNSFIPEIISMAVLHDKPSLFTLHLPLNDKHAIMYQLFAERTGSLPVSISTRMQEDWQPVFGHDIPQVPNGVDLDRWTLSDNQSKDFLLWCGRISKDKNLKGAIALANHVHRPLKIVGPIFEQAYFDEEIAPLLHDDIEYLGHKTQAQIHALAGGAAAFLATATWREPFGFSTLEMLASGVPVVGFTTAIPPELRHDGVSVAIESADWHDLIEPLQTVGTAQPEDCRAVAAALSLDRTAQAYTELYEQVISGQS